MMDTLEDTGWDSDSSVGENEAVPAAEASSGGVAEEAPAATAEHAEEEEDLSDPRGLLPRNSELRAQRQQAAAAAKAQEASLAQSAASPSSASARAASTEQTERRRLLGDGVAATNAPRGPIDRAFYRWVRNAPLATLEELFWPLPADKRIRVCGRADGTFLLGMRSLRMKLLPSTRDGVGASVKGTDLCLSQALPAICRTEQVRLRGAAAALTVLLPFKSASSW